jgi:cytochrome c-type biogenesis protein CcmH
VIQAEVRNMLAGGASEQAILDHYVREYGERILAKPKKKGFNLAAYWVPYLAILAGAGVILAIVRRGMGGRSKRVATRSAEAASSPPAGPPASKPKSDDDYRQRVEEELRRSL